MVLGKELVQLALVKNQSSCSKRGSVCMLLQVKDLPLIGSSMRACELMRSLKVILSLRLPPGLLRLSGLRMKLKSPTNSQSSLAGMFNWTSH